MAGEALFSTVPQEDYLGLYDDGRTDLQKVVKLLDLTRRDVAAATHVRMIAVRYDRKAPRELRERVQQWATALQLVAGHFGGDLDKTVLWFRTPNPLLGHVAPRDMIRLGRFPKLMKFIQTALAENEQYS